jgi:phosphatidylcholine synthase
VADDDLRTAFIWLAVALLVDASDGWFARTARVHARIPIFDGARLDDIVDYLTFVFVPLYLIEHSGRLPSAVAGWVVAAALLASAYGFGRTDAKTPDHFFTGFPSYWNIVALYVVALNTGPWLNAGLLTALAGLVFVPIKYVYPSRTETLRPLTMVLGILWGFAMVAIIWQLPQPPLPLVVGSLLFPLYYVILSVALHVRAHPDPGRRDRPN